MYYKIRSLYIIVNWTQNYFKLKYYFLINHLVEKLVKDYKIIWLFSQIVIFLFVIFCLTTNFFVFVLIKELKAFQKYFEIWFIFVDFRKRDNFDHKLRFVCFEEIQGKHYRFLMDEWFSCWSVVENYNKNKWSLLLLRINAFKSYNGYNGTHEQ